MHHNKPSRTSVDSLSSLSLSPPPPSTPSLIPAHPQCKRPFPFITLPKLKYTIHRLFTTQETRQNPFCTLGCLRRHSLRCPQRSTTAGRCIRSSFAYLCLLIHDGHLPFQGSTHRTQRCDRPRPRHNPPLPQPAFAIPSFAFSNRAGLLSILAVTPLSPLSPCFC